MGLAVPESRGRCRGPVGPALVRETLQGVPGPVLTPTPGAPVSPFFVRGRPWAVGTPQGEAGGPTVGPGGGEGSGGARVLRVRGSVPLGRPDGPGRPW